MQIVQDNVQEYIQIHSLNLLEKSTAFYIDSLHSIKW